MVEDGGGEHGSMSRLPWRTKGGGSRGSWGSGNRSGCNLSGSDGPSGRKTEEGLGSVREDMKHAEEGKVTSPIKKTDRNQSEGDKSKELFYWNGVAQC